MSVEAGQNNQSDVENASRSSWIRRLPSWRVSWICGDFGIFLIFCFKYKMEQKIEIIKKGF
jgi:hypothetical protein